MRLPWRKKDTNGAVEQATKKVEEQKSEIDRQRQKVDAVVRDHRRILRENHLAEAIRNALQDSR